MWNKLYYSRFGQTIICSTILLIFNHIFGFESTIIAGIAMILGELNYQAYKNNKNM